MNIKERFDEIINISVLLSKPLTERDVRWLFTIGLQEGMREAARMLEADWFKTQQDCSKAIRDASNRL